MTREELEKELSNTKTGLENAKKRSSSLRQQVLDYKKHMNGLIWQYERVIKDYRVTLQQYKDNLTKMFLISLFLKVKRKLGGEI